MEVTLYSNHCPQCKVLETKLKDKNVVYTEVNDVDLMLSKGFMSMPMLEVDGNVMNFASALKWVNEN
ncbi:MAG: hypothetical protein K0R54_2755 [Clostridiaceae bacterium]|jgi:glutaredoxin|nr:hypothetical protein [Clostridiaceae bacterium]MDF2950473.1 hypothetical protein [Anaerocolumna sp.]